MIRLVELIPMGSAPTAATPPRPLPIVAGHLALDFANTVDDPEGPGRYDHAATYDAVVDWAARTGALTDAQSTSLLEAAASDPKATDQVLAEAHELRDVLNDLFGRVADGGDDLAGPWARLRPFVADALAAAVLDAARPGAKSWSWPQEDDLAVVLHPVASAAADLLVSRHLQLVKRCARCPWLFLDSSKNHSRRWCDMNDCGKAQKIERYVARRAATRRSTTRDD